MGSTVHLVKEENTDSLNDCPEQLTHTQRTTHLWHQSCAAGLPLPAMRVTPVLQKLKEVVFSSHCAKHMKAAEVDACLAAVQKHYEEHELESRNADVALVKATL